MNSPGLAQVKSVDCSKCGASLEVSISQSVVVCRFCGSTHKIDTSSSATRSLENLVLLARRAFDRGEYGKCLQLVEEGLRHSPESPELLDLEASATAKLIEVRGEIESELDAASEAELYHLQAQFILGQLQANIKVYGSNSPLTGADPANIELAVRYIDRSLELVPDSVRYLNTKALLLGDSGKDKAEAIRLLERANELNPKDITVEENLKNFRKSACFVATAAFDGSESETVRGLRDWRDDFLSRTAWGRFSIAVYYKLSPSLARIVWRRPKLKAAARFLLMQFFSRAIRNRHKFSGK